MSYAVNVLLYFQFVSHASWGIWKIITVVQSVIWLYTKVILLTISGLLKDFNKFSPDFCI